MKRMLCDLAPRLGQRQAAEKIGPFRDENASSWRRLMKMNGVRKVVNIESVINSTAHDHCDSAVEFYFRLVLL